MCYAEIRDDNLIILKDKLSNKLSASELHNLGGKSTFINESYVTLDDKINLADNTNEFRFGPIKETKFSRFIPGVFWMGRHFSVSSQLLNKTRYYTICLTLENNIKMKHLNLLENVKILEEGSNNLNINMLNENELVSDYLNLYIKAYDFPNTLSNHINNLNTKSQSDLIIKGPCVNLF
jgi:hypothetical protein